MAKMLLKPIFFNTVLLLTSCLCFAKIQVNDSTSKFFMIAASASYQIPGGDMVKRFGNSFTAGGVFQFKTKSNLLFSFDGDFITGEFVKEPGLLQNITTNDGAFIGVDGKFANVIISERGYDFVLRAGKIFTLIGPNKNSGILLSAGIGFMQHKIRIDDKDKTVEQLKGNYRKGYDRLTNGMLLRQFIAYQNFSNNRLVNFFIGIELNTGFTKNRRAFNFDTMTADTKTRHDFLFALKAGWIIPFYRRDKDRVYYN